MLSLSCSTEKTVEVTMILRYYLDVSKHIYEEQGLKLRLLNSLITSCRSSDALKVTNEIKSQSLFVKANVWFPVFQ